MTPRMAIIGGGPIGLECLVRAVAEGWDATLFERGSIGENVRAWGHVRMFSPWSMNLTPGASIPGLDPAALPTGAEYVTHRLEPMAQRPEIASRIHQGCEVAAIARSELRKSDAIGSPERAGRPFRLLVVERGRERHAEAEVVVDASGSFATSNWLGEGGIPAIGERELRETIEHRLPDILSRDRPRFVGHHTTVVGHGHSAATAIGWLSTLARQASGTRVTWITRSNAARPVTELPGDPLRERTRVSVTANDLAERGAPWLTCLRGSRVREVKRANGGVAIVVGGVESPRVIQADRVLALVGYRPDLSFLSELQVQTCWATEGTYPLAAALLSRGGAADCLTAGAGLDVRALLHPEPGFFVLGAKSYGRNPDFLIRAGLDQIENLFALLRDRRS
jgi:thioredoxin reductase